MRVLLWFFNPVWHWKVQALYSSMQRSQQLQYFLQSLTHQGPAKGREFPLKHGIESVLPVNVTA